MLNIIWKLLHAHDYVRINAWQIMIDDQPWRGFQCICDEIEKDTSDIWRQDVCPSHTQHMPLHDSKVLCVLLSAMPTGDGICGASLFLSAT